MVIYNVATQHIDRYQDLDVILRGEEIGDHTRDGPDWSPQCQKLLPDGQKNVWAVDKIFLVVGFGGG